MDAILLCVATEKGYAVLRAVNEMNLDRTLHVCSFKETKVVRQFYDDILSYAERHHIPLHSWSEIREGGVDWLRKKKIYAMVCVGWRYLVPAEMRKWLGGRILATHDSLLPRYRGFAPLASALINGESEVGVTVMLAAEEVDAGDIVYQEKVKVNPADTIATLTKKVIPLFTRGVTESLRKLVKGTLMGTPQDHSKSTYSVWRDEDDLWIDWNESAEFIERMVRALGPPYMGARTRMRDEIVVIHSARILPDFPFEIRQPGKVWTLSQVGAPVVLCGRGMLLIQEATAGDRPLIPMKNLRVRFKGGAT